MKPLNYNTAVTLVTVALRLNPFFLLYLKKSSEGFSLTNLNFYVDTIPDDLQNDITLEDVPKLAKLTAEILINAISNVEEMSDAELREMLVNIIFKLNQQHENNWQERMSYKERERIHQMLPLDNIPIISDKNKSHIRQIKRKTNAKMNKFQHRIKKIKID